MRGRNFTFGFTLSFYCYSPSRSFHCSTMAPSAVDSVSQLPLKVVSPEKKGNGLVNLELGAGDQNDKVLKTFRCLIADLCEQFKGGHPGQVNHPGSEKRR